MAKGTRWEGLGAIPRDLFLEIARGLVPGHSIAFIAGSNTGACTKYEDVWDAGELNSLDYDAQTGNFTPGLVVTGGTSGATAVIVVDDDAGAAGNLTLRKVDGDFIDNEALTDSSTGAAVADGVLLEPHRAMDYPTAGEQWEVVCESATDTLAGTGAQKLLISYLDASHAPQTVEADTGGATPTAISPSDALRFRSATVIQWGSATEPIFVKCNAGGIVIRDASTQKVRGYIPFDDDVVGDEHGLNNTRSSHYTPPGGSTAFLYDVTSNTSKDHESDTIGAVRFFGTDGFISLAQRFVYQSSVDLAIPFAPLLFPGKTDVKFVARSNNTRVPITTSATFIVIED